MLSRGLGFAFLAAMGSVEVGEIVFGELDDQELIATLSAAHPDDAEDLAEALQVLQRQKITSLDRLAKLTESQWGSLG